MITLFEGFKKIPNVNSVTPEFWEMVDVADWNSFIEKYNDETRTIQYKDILNDARYRLYIKYSFDELNEFAMEYNKIYEQFRNYFKSIWIDNNLMSEDSYSDLISSIIGRGKEFAKNIILNTEVFMRMAKTEDYAENFCYLFSVNKREYDKILEPMYKDISKLNL